MDMREMVDKVKKGESLWGKSELNEHQQGVAHRNSRYTGVFLHVIPMFNFVNHPYVSLEAEDCLVVETWWLTCDSSMELIRRSTISRRRRNWRQRA